MGLNSVDHIAQTMQYEEFLSWLLYYVALFDVAKTPQVEIADTLGLVQSQAVEVAGQVATLHAQWIDGVADAVRALHPQLYGRWGAAYCLCTVQMCLQPPKPHAPTACRCSKFRATIMTIWKRVSACGRSG